MCITFGMFMSHSVYASREHYFVTLSDLLLSLCS